MMNPSGGRTGPALSDLTGEDQDYQHPVINLPANKLEQYLINDYKSQRQDYVSMVGSIKNIGKVSQRVLMCR